MDSNTVDGTRLPRGAAAEGATLIGADGGERISAEDVAGWSGTISYEVLTSIGRRVARVHRN